MSECGHGLPPPDQATCGHSPPAQPEAADGGVIALVRDKDCITFDAVARAIDLCVGDAEFATRKTVVTDSGCTRWTCGSVAGSSPCRRRRHYDGHQMKIGFCGLGLMGAPMVRQLLAAGHDVKIWNRSAARTDALASLGAHVAATPAEAAGGVDGVLMCLFDAAAVESVVFGRDGVAQGRGLAWIADHSSIAPDATRALAARLGAGCGADWIDAPVSGGVAGVEAGTLVVMAGGPLTHFDQAAAVMRAYAGKVTHMGSSGAGQATKLCNQTIVAATVVAIAEALGLAERNGIDVDRLASALAGGWADSKLLQVFAPRMIRAQAESIGALSTMLKDVDTVMATAQTSAVPMPLTAGVQQTLRIAQAMGLGQAELSAVISVVSPQRRQDFLQQAQR